MDELGAAWPAGKQREDDLKHKILMTTFELETVRMEVSKIKHQSEMNQMHLLALLQLAFEERNEARQQLQQLLDTFMFPSSTHVATQTKPHSGITDHQSNDGIDSFFDTVSSTDKSSKYMEDFSKEYDNDEELNSYNLNPIMLGAGQPMAALDLDHADNLIDQLVNGKMLPSKGRLLEAVMKAGPTLQSMMLSGPLPQWKNPPSVIHPLGFHPGMMINNVHATNQSMLRPSLSAFMHEPSAYPSPIILNTPHVDGANVIDLKGGSACMNKDQRTMDIGNNKRPRML